MDQFQNDVGVLVPNVLLPGREADFTAWACVACDQFTSQPEYWAQVEALTGGKPSAYRLILPEAFLGKPGEAERIERINKTMEEYIETGVLEEKERGFVLVTRTVEGKRRRGLIMALDLEAYDYNKGATTLIRATEGTIVDRIPPRLRIRENAPLELPHILVLIDDPACTVIEPLAEMERALPLLYDTELMQDGGHVTGRLVSDTELIGQVLRALTCLADPDAFRAKYGEGAAPLLFAMGDGNHSLATAKANWERIKQQDPDALSGGHPARYALVEVENVHDAGIVFEPIHRVLFGVKPAEAKETLLALLNAQNGAAALVAGEAPLPTANTHVLPFTARGEKGAFVVTDPKAQLPVGTLQNAIDALIANAPGAEVDYIHGADVVAALADKHDAIGFLLPAMEKSALFPTVIYDGALPRKTFSMGEANEKRYYLECRRITNG